MAGEKLGFQFKTFGPGGAKSNHPSINADTYRVLAQDPHITAFLSPTPIDEEGKKLEAAGKVTVLDRVPGVSIERSVGAPDFNWFLEGYAKNPDREYFVLQGHPNTWDEATFAEVTRIIDFLIEHKAVFMTPSEFAAHKKGASGR